MTYCELTKADKRVLRDWIFTGPLSEYSFRKVMNDRELNRLVELRGFGEGFAQTKKNPVLLLRQEGSGSLLRVRAENPWAERGFNQELPLADVMKVIPPYKRKLFIMYM